MLEDAAEKGLLKKVRELEWQVIQLQHDLIHDALTGLKTRAYFEEQVGSYLSIIGSAKESDSERRERFGFSTLSLLFADIDHFKLVNDRFGHDAGDLALKRAAEAIKRNVRLVDCVARWGGEEIAVSLLGTSEADAAAKANDIRELIEELTFPEVKGLALTVSIGVATFTKGTDLAALVKRADQALYKAKEAGRNKVVAHSEL